MADPIPAPWAPGATRPTTIPDGMEWDDSLAAFKPKTAAAPPAWVTDPQWAGLDPRLTALYQKHNVSPTGDGTGFTDARYWDKKLKTDPNYDYLTRLDKDLSGTGTDRSTGTVWGAAGAPAGVDKNASDAMPNMAGSQLAGLSGGSTSGISPVFDVTSQGNGPGSYAWRQAQIYALQQRLANGQW